MTIKIPYPAADPVASLHLTGRVLLDTPTGFLSVWNPDPEFANQSRPCGREAHEPEACEFCADMILTVIEDTPPPV
jgi:hypothetical protein